LLSGVGSNCRQTLPDSRISGVSAAEREEDRAGGTRLTVVRSGGGGLEQLIEIQLHFFTAEAQRAQRALVPLPS
jgi:hypothetical protein